MAKYAATGRRASGTNLTVLTVGNPGSGPKRARLFELQLSSRDTPVDQALNFAVLRATALGTSTAVTPEKFDPADAAAVMLAGEAHSAEPTYTAGSELIDQAFNLKAIFRFVTAPEWGFVIPATASNGLGVRSLAVSSGTPNIECTVHFEE